MAAIPSKYVLPRKKHLITIDPSFDGHTTPSFATKLDDRGTDEQTWV